MEMVREIAEDLNLPVGTVQYFVGCVVREVAENPALSIEEAITRAEQKQVLYANDPRTRDLIRDVFWACAIA